MKKDKAALAAVSVPDASSDASARPAKARVPRIGVRGRIFTYFLVFTAALLLLLWVFQIALLPSFYRLQKTWVLDSAIDALASNIDNARIQALADRVAQASDVCVLIVDGRANTVASAEAVRDSVILRMSRFDLNRFITMAARSDTTLYRIFSLEGPKVSADQEEEDRFNGRVPPQTANRGQSMVGFRAVPLADGTLRYVFVDTQITPVDATVQTLQSQYLFIALFMVVLSFLLSLVLSRRIAQPIIGANEAAKGLALGRYQPERSRVGYREIEQLNQTLTKAAADLRRVEVLQRELIANISHDLRTPLTLIEGYAEAIRDLPGENTPENMQVIIDEARRLTSLVNAVLEYSTAQSGHMSINADRFNITQSIEYILSRYQKLVEKDGYSIRYSPEHTLWVTADEMKIGQVVYNLVNNALTYTGADKTVTVSQMVKGNMVHVEVRDTGEGIETDELPHIWNRYYRGTKPHKRATVGTGLGLSIVKGILDAHGLPYGVQSVKGEGTVFWFELPLTQ